MRAFDLPGRSAVHASEALAATSHPRATMAALDTLKAGGNAVDAAIAASAVLCVVEAHMTGIGGDCFVLYKPADGPLVSYNGSGRAPAGATTEAYLDRGITRVPGSGPHAVTIPGAVEAWATLIADHGRLTLGDVLQTAIALAEEGYPLAPRIAWDWMFHEAELAADPATRAVMTRDGKVPKVGDIHRQPALAATLRRIATDGPAAFYTGEVAEKMAATLSAAGGFHTADDFANHFLNHSGAYTEAITADYRGHSIAECPPNGHGLAALQMFMICQGFDVGGLDPLSAERLHLECEAGRFAYRDRDRHTADPDVVPVPVEQLLSEEYAAELRAVIDPDNAMANLPPPAIPQSSDTIYLCVVDGDGNAISFINSLYSHFGAMVLCPETGVMFQNRGACFVVEPGHPNTIAPGKRPLHTIMPGMVMKDGEAVMPFGVMGGHYQPFGHYHLVSNMLDFGMDPQEAIELPRVWHYGGGLQAERTVPAETLQTLAAMGHAVEATAVPIGGGQAIWIDRERGTLIGGSDHRKDGLALGW